MNDNLIRANGFMTSGGDPFDITFPIGRSAGIGEALKQGNHPAHPE